MVDMHPGCRLARRVGVAVGGTRHAAPQGVVEDEHPAGAGRLRDKALRLGVVDPAHLVLVPEIAHCAALLDKGEALAIERDFGLDRPHIVDAHQMRLVHHVRAHLAGLRVVGVIARPLGHWHEVVQLGLDVTAACHKLVIARILLVAAVGAAQNGGNLGQSDQTSDLVPVTGFVIAAVARENSRPSARAARTKTRRRGAPVGIVCIIPSRTVCR